MGWLAMVGGAPRGLLGFRGGGFELREGVEVFVEEAVLTVFVDLSSGGHPFVVPRGVSLVSACQVVVVGLRS